MIDSHCHLDHEPLLSDLTNVIKRSRQVGIKKLLTISTSFESFDRIKTIIKKDEMIYGTIGIHPHETNENKITSDIIVKNITENDKIIGIGETGLDFAKKLLTLNAFFSASGIITFKNSTNLQETFNFLPLDKILIETDSPFLAPVPNRGKKNEPSFIDYTAQKLADIKNISKLELINSTTNNFNKLFF